MNELREIDKYLLQGNRKIMEKTREQYRYAGHQQWDELIKRGLLDESRPVLEIDITSPKINTAVGVEKEFRAGIEMLPFESGDKRQSEMATYLLKHTNRNQTIDRAASRVWKDIVTCGRGVFDNHPVKGDDFMLECASTRESPFRVRVDPAGLNPDQSDWNYMGRDKWMTDEQIKSMWPNSEFKPISHDMSEDQIISLVIEDDKDYFETNVSTLEYIDASKRKRRVAEIYQRKHMQKDFLLNAETGEVFKMQEVMESNLFAFIQVRNQIRYNPKDEKELAEILRINGLPFMIVSRPHSEIHMGIYTAGGVLQELSALPYEHGEFPLVMAYGYLGEEPTEGLLSFGIVEGLIGVQDEKNKRRSQALDLLIRTPRNAGFYSLDADIDAEALNKMYISGEWVGIRGDVDKKIKERDHAALPILGNIANMEDRAENDAINISGINLPLQGIPTSSRESGVAAQTRIKQGVMGLSEPLENLDAARTRVYKQNVRNIQQYYPPAKLRRILGNEFEPQEIEEFIQNYRYTKYDAVVSQEQSPTAKRWQLAIAVELLQYGVPPELLMSEIVRLSDMPSGDQIIGQMNTKQLLQAMDTSQKPA